MKLLHKVFLVKEVASIVIVTIFSLTEINLIFNPLFDLVFISSVGVITCTTSTLSWSEPILILGVPDNSTGLS